MSGGRGRRPATTRARAPPGRTAGAGGCRRAGAGAATGDLGLRQSSAAGRGAADGAGGTSATGGGGLHDRAVGGHVDDRVDQCGSGSLGGRLRARRPCAPRRAPSGGREPAPPAEAAGRRRSADDGRAGRAGSSAVEARGDRPRGKGGHAFEALASAGGRGRSADDTSGGRAAPAGQPVTTRRSRGHLVEDQRPRLAADDDVLDPGPVPALEVDPGLHAERHARRPAARGCPRPGTAPRGPRGRCRARSGGRTAARSPRP